MSVSELEHVQVESRAELRDWLQSNHGRTTGIWLVTFKKHVAGKYVASDVMVDEALCFGWIDSRVRKLDDERSMLLLSPRRPGSPWSRFNKQRVGKLIADGLMMPPGLEAIERAKQDGSWSIYDDIEDLIVPDDLSAALAENADAACSFRDFSASSKKAILWWIKSAKQPVTRQRRVAETVRLAQYGIRANHPEAQAFKRKLGEL